jgi:hypothetical protein
VFAFLQAEQMIANNIRVNNECYVAPVYREAIAAGMKIKSYAVNKMWAWAHQKIYNIFSITKI